MNSHPYYRNYGQQTPNIYDQGYYPPYTTDQQPMMPASRQTPELQARVDQLARQSEEQARELNRQNDEMRRINEEIARINEEIRRVNEEIARLYQNDEIHTDRLQRLNQRLRTVERGLNIPFTPTEDGF